MKKEIINYIIYRNLNFLQKVSKNVYTLYILLNRLHIFEYRIE